MILDFVVIVQDLGCFTFLTQFFSFALIWEKQIKKAQRIECSSLNVKIFYLLKLVLL